MRNFTLSALSLVTVLGLVRNAQSGEAKDKDKVERKTITVINAESKADGSSEIGREAVKECIVALPKVEALEPEVISDSRYLKEIGGDPNKNEWTKIYSAKITVNYMVYHKDILIVATKTVEGKEPVLRDVEKHLPKTQEFLSNPADGDTFAGRSNRQYYFTKSEDAAKDAKARAMVWLKQQAPLLCSETK
jgi:hypothetical protein